MRNHGIVKGLALVLCAACLMTAVFSGVGLAMLTAMNLGENQSPAQWYQESIQQSVDSDAENLVARYAEASSPHANQEFVAERYGYVDRLISRREMNYEILDSSGKTLEKSENYPAELTEFRSTVKKDRASYSVLLEGPVLVKYEEDLDAAIKKLQGIPLSEEADAEDWNPQSEDIYVDVREGPGGYKLYRYQYVPLEQDYTVIIHADPRNYDTSIDGKIMELGEIVWRHQTQVMILLGGSLALFGALAVYLCMAAGRKPGSEELRPGGLNCLPLDLYAGLTLSVALLYLSIGVAGVRYLLGQSNVILAAYYGYGGYLCCLIFVGFCFACAAQFKTPGHYWWHHSVTGMCWHIAKWCWSLCWHMAVWTWRRGWAIVRWLLTWGRKRVKSLWHRTQAVLGKLRGLVARGYALLPLTWQWLAVPGCLAVVFILAIAARSEFLAVLSVLAGIGAILYAANAFGTLLEAAGRMRTGDLEIKVADRLLVGKFKEFAQELNGISEVVQTAAQKQMRSERMRTELITNVTHDIKTPLTSIINYVDLLQKPHSEEDTDTYLEVLSRQSGRMKKLIDDLIELSKASTGNIPVELCRVDAVEAVNQALGEFTDRLTAAQLTPVFRQPTEPLYIRADGRLVWRAMSNLLSNAVKYAQPGTRFYVDMVALDGKVCVSFKNISREELNVSAEELMERFVRGEASRNQEGSGLGLNIAQSMMELQHGTLELLVDGDLFKATLVFPQDQGSSE